MIKNKFKNGQRHFLKQLLENDYDRTPLTITEIALILMSLQENRYNNRAKKIFNELRGKYREHVWGTKITNKWKQKTTMS